MSDWGCPNCGMLWGHEVSGPTCPDCGAKLIPEDKVDTHLCEVCGRPDPDGDGVCEACEADGLGSDGGVEQAETATRESDVDDASEDKEGDGW